VHDKKSGEYYSLILIEMNCNYGKWHFWKNLASKIFSLFLLIILTACSNQLVSNYEFPEHEFNDIHRNIINGHRGLHVVGVFEWPHIELHLQMPTFGPEELKEATGRLFEQIIAEAINPVYVEWYPYHPVIDTRGPVTGPNRRYILHPESTDLDRIDRIPGMNELIDVYISADDLTENCLWDNWGILSDALGNLNAATLD